MVNNTSKIDIKNGLGRIWIVSIGVKEKPSTWEGNSYLIELINVF